jgi:hypothetical protein
MLLMQGPFSRQHLPRTAPHRTAPHQFCIGSWISPSRPHFYNPTSGYCIAGPQHQLFIIFIMPLRRARF